MSIDIEAGLRQMKSLVERYECGDAYVVQAFQGIVAERKSNSSKILNNIRRGEGYIGGKTSLPGDVNNPWVHGSDLLHAGASLGERLLEEGEEYAGARRVRFNRPVTQNLNLYVGEELGKLPEIIDPVLELNLLTTKGRLLRCIGEQNGELVYPKANPNIFLIKLLPFLQIMSDKQKTEPVLKTLVAEQLDSATERLVAAFDLATYGGSSCFKSKNFRSTLIASVNKLSVPPTDWMLNKLEFTIQQLEPVKTRTSSGAQILSLGLNIEVPEKRPLAEVQFALCDKASVGSNGKLLVR